MNSIRVLVVLLMVMFSSCYGEASKRRKQIDVTKFLETLPKTSKPSIQCPEVYKKECTTDDECLCDKLKFQMICNSYKECNTLQLVDIIARYQKNKCNNVFKSKCKTDADCYCTKRKLHCEQRECVGVKPRPKSSQKYVPTERLKNNHKSETESTENKDKTPERRVAHKEDQYLDTGRESYLAQ